ncbi:MAG: RNA polymerase sigma factor, partial [Planctomycetota bacterium]
MSSASPIPDLEELRRHEAWLRPMLRALVGESDTNDVLQRTWLRAWQQPPQSQHAWRAWLARTATRFAMSHGRAEQRRRRHEANVEPPLVAESTVETVERLTVQRAVNAAVTDLAEPYRTAVLLRHYHGLSVDEVARQTGTKPANVRQRVHRGLELIRVRLEREFGSDWRRSPAVLAIAAWPGA